MNQRKKKEQDVGSIASNADGFGEIKPRRPYVSPQVLSAENLEAMAAACNPPAAGKSQALGCGTLTRPLGS